VDAFDARQSISFHGSFWGEFMFSKRFFFSTDRSGLILALTFFMVLLLLSSGPASAEVRIDGRIDEAEWAGAKSYDNFVITEPWTLQAPSFATQAKVLSLPEGLAVAFICEHPPEEPRTRTGTMPDARNFNSDFVTLLVDFDGTGATGYEFSVSLAGSYRDGNISMQNKFSYDWDGIWERAVHEETDRWSVEILLPWSIVGMREGDGDTRRIGVCFQRGLNSRNETSSFPALNADKLPFITEFQKIDITEYSKQQLDISPYITLLSDLVADDITTKIGGDLFWKYNGKLQVSGTINPDFGQVESDNLVINFSATETFFSDKRPFFTENQSLFTLSLPPMNYILHTRRIGGNADDGSGPSDIDGAVKVMGSLNNVSYGLFAAQESDDAGRDFYAGRLTIPTDNWSVGWLGTFVDRPFMERTARVNALDYNLTLKNLFFRGIFLRSDIEAPTEDSTGYAGYAMMESQVTDSVRLITTVTHYDDTVDFNDMGFMGRNDLDEGMLMIDLKQSDFGEDSSTALVTWVFRTFQRWNTDGDHLPSDMVLIRDQQFNGGAIIRSRAVLTSSGYDDLISRGNGLVWQDQQWDFNLSYETQRRGLWRKSIGLQVYQEGIDDWSYGLDLGASFYPRENITADLTVKPSHSRDWLIWLENDLMASFERNKLAVDLSATWFPADRHEIRLRTQWLVIDAEDGQGYRIGNDARLEPSSDVIRDFTATNFGLQFRYRYEIAPLSDIYLVYSRGGMEYTQDPEEDFLDLLGNTTCLRDSDQILLKLRYRF
jgi:hypothetical protein